jgi:hypothetical protein
MRRKHLGQPSVVVAGANEDQVIAKEVAPECLQGAGESRAGIAEHEVRG